MRPGALVLFSGLHFIAGGVGETEFSGYLDDRENTVTSMQATLTLGLEHHSTKRDHPSDRDTRKNKGWSLIRASIGTDQAPARQASTKAPLRDDKT